MSEAVKNEKPKSKFYVYVLYLLLILSITGLVLYFSLRGDQYKKVYSMLLNIDYGYFSLFIGFIVISFFINTFILFLFARLYTSRYKFHQAVANNFVGTFYSGITPGSYYTGGQFAQAYTYKQQGLHFSSAASILVMQYIVYQTSMLIISTVSLVIVCIFNTDILATNIIPPSIFNEENVYLPLWIFVIIGFVVNISVIGLLYLMSYSKRIQNFIIVKVLNLLNKIGIVKNLEQRREKMKITVENFRIELRRLQSNLRFTILIYLLTIIVLIITFSYPMLCALGFHLPLKNITNTSYTTMFIDGIALTNIHQVAISGIPIPGGAGISEYIFFYIFRDLFDTSYIGYNNISSSEICNGVMLLWRICTFLLPFSVSGIVGATYKSRGLNSKEIFYPYMKEQFVTIQFEAMSERNIEIEHKDLLEQNLYLEIDDVELTEKSQKGTDDEEKT